MKKIFLLALISLSLTVFAQDEELPEKVNKAFVAKYPGIEINNWVSDEGLYYLEYYMKSNMYTSVFTKEGLWQETSEIIADTDIPNALKDYIKNNYPKGEIAYTEKVQSSNLAYFVRVNLSTDDKYVIIQSALDGRNIKIVDEKKY